MEKKHLYIYGRREMAILVFLGVMVALFSFTLGVHLGKKLEIRQRQAVSGATTTVVTSNDVIPTKQEINEQGKGASDATDELLNQSVHDEVVRTGAKLDQQVPIQLPEKTRSANAGATNTQVPPAKAEAKPQQEAKTQDVKKPEAAKTATKKTDRLTEESVPAALRPAPAGHFSLQIGSYRTLDEAADQANVLESSGQHPYLRSIDLKQKGKWYRLYLGGYASQADAEKAGAKSKATGIIDSFVVVKKVE